LPMQHDIASPATRRAAPSNILPQKFAQKSKKVQG
jgi:hypothetical protein